MKKSSSKNRRRRKAGAPSRPRGKGITVVCEAFTESPRQRQSATSPATPAPAPATTSTLRGVRADELDEELLATWKHNHQAKTLAEYENDLARSAVKASMDAKRADYFLSTLGTIPLQMRGGTPQTDWQAIAREGIGAKKLEALIAKHTRLTPVTPTLSAPAGWSAELGLPKKD